MPKKEELPQHVNATGSTGLSGKSITGIDLYVAGTWCVVEINYVGGPYRIKFRNLQIEIGGDANWGTGTIL